MGIWWTSKLTSQRAALSDSIATQEGSFLVRKSIQTLFFLAAIPRQLCLQSRQQKSQTLQMSRPSQMYIFLLGLIGNNQKTAPECYLMKRQHLLLGDVSVSSSQRGGNQMLSPSFLLETLPALFDFPSIWRDALAQPLLAAHGPPGRPPVTR